MISPNAVSEQLLAPYGLEHNHLYSALSLLTERQIDYADIYCQSSYHERWMIEESIIKQSSYNMEHGIGIRVIHNDKTGFSYTNNFELDALLESARTARAISNEKTNKSVGKLIQAVNPPIYASIDPLSCMEQQDKIALLYRLDRLARSIDPRVCEVTATLDGTYELVLVATTDGNISADIRPLVRLMLTVLVSDSGRSERGRFGGGRRSGYEYFFQTVDGEVRAEWYVKQAVEQALINLYAMPAPAGTFPIVLGAGWPGILLHEAVGHGLEADFNRKNSSRFAGCIGKQVASPLCTIIDDGSLQGRCGSLTIDDEGTTSRPNILIENGILKSYMQDKLNARLMNMEPTGNARRESYAHLPMPRMTNTYMLGGTHSPQEIIASVDYGLYAPCFSGGQVDITSGNFVFCTSLAYLIEKGQLTKAVKGATLIGCGIDTMQKISMLGNDVELDEGIGTCGKAGQSVPVSVGQPTVKVDSMTIGGTAIN